MSDHAVAATQTAEKKSPFITAISTYLVPTSLKQLAIALGLQQAICFGTGSLLYPSPEKVLTGLGVDKTSIQKFMPLFPATVKPTGTERTVIDKIHSLTEMPTLLGVLKYWEINTKPSAYAIPFLACQISAPTIDNFKLYDHLSAYSDLPAHHFKKLPVNEKDVLTFTLLHESAHCKPSIPFQDALKKMWNQAVTLFGATDHSKKFNLIKDENEEEMHADFSYLAWLKTHPSQEYRQMGEEYLLNFRAFQLTHTFFKDKDFTHDVVLAIDARITGKSLPPYEEMRKSREEFARAVRAEVFEKDAGILAKDMDSAYGYIIQGIENILDAQSETLSPLAKRRGELFLQAATYFIPEIAKTARTLPPLKPYKVDLLFQNTHKP